MAEFRAHDAAVRAEKLAEEEADREAYNQHEASLAQQWDDWAVASEMNHTQQAPSRKRVRITVCAGTGSGHDIGEACIEGVIAHGQQATVSFSIVETLVGGLDRPITAMGSVNTHASPQFASYERDHLPGLPETVQDFLCSLEGRHWLWRLQEGTANAGMMVEKFGHEIAEAAQLWIALQEDMDKGVRNMADGTLTATVAGNGEAESTSGSSTVTVANEDHKENSLTGEEVSRIEAEGEGRNGDEDDGQDESEAEGDIAAEAEEVQRTMEAEEGMENNGEMEENGGCEMAAAEGGDGLGVCATIPDSLHMEAIREEQNELDVAPPLDEASAGTCEAGEHTGDAMDMDDSNHERVEEGKNVTEAASVDVNQNERDAYCVPPEWQRVLRAWNDPAIGAGLEDSLELWRIRTSYTTL